MKRANQPVRPLIPVYFKIKNLKVSIFRSTGFTFEIWMEIACDREKGNLGILAKAVVEERALIVWLVAI